MPTSGDQDENWFRCLAEAQEILTAWEAEVGRILVTREAVALIERIAHGLKRSFERGRAEPQDG